MAGVHASDALSGHILDHLTQGATNVAGMATETAPLPFTGARVYLDASSAAQGYGAGQGVFTNGRYREGGSRESSAERGTAAGNVPCGIMKVGKQFTPGSQGDTREMRLV